MAVTQRRQADRSERSRGLILNAALELFAHQGYRGTNVREIAARAGVSTGNVYHHFPEKELIFRTLLDQYWEVLASSQHPINRALADGAFPEDLERLGRAARESVERYRPYIALIYVDVVEFEGKHIQTYYASMAARFDAFVEQHPGAISLDRLRPDVAPGFAAMLASRVFLQFFAVEIIFGAHGHFGRGNEAVVRDIADILAHGMLRPEPTATAP
jgi:AcrR family transcriptional regulator